MNPRIPLFELNMGEPEERAVVSAIKSGWISMGERVMELEQRFAAHLGARHAVAVTNCTAALHLATSILVEPGDEVIVPSLTFVATANAVRYAGARPVFADITSIEDLSIDPEDVERRITPRTKALIPVHYGGFACDMGALTKIAKKHDLRVIEDAAHAPNSSYGDDALGTIGDMGCYSFFSNKNITCAEGGMLVTDSDENAQRARLQRSHGMTTVSYDRAHGHATRYEVVELGFNYRMDDIRASLALAQFERLKEDTARRQVLRNRYMELLGGLDDIVIPYENAPFASCNYIFVVVLRNGGALRRDAIRAHLASGGIETSVHYPAVHRFDIYSRAAPALPNTEFVSDHLITLPLFARMTDAQVERVCEAFKTALSVCVAA